MIILKRFPAERLVNLYQKWPGKNQGAALVISLLIILALVLLGLSILLQSNTEHMIAVNERDATAALFDAEAGLQLTKGKLTNPSTDLNLLLRGPDNDPNPVIPNDNGVMQIRTVQTGMNKDSLNANCSAGSTTCEATNSVIEVDSSGDAWEVFRIGVDPDGSAPANESGWEGPRGLLYVRVDDNHDEVPATDDPYTDLDKRVTVTVRARYPIRVDANGNVVADQAGEMGSAFLRTVGISERTLVARFGPSALQPAIVSRTDMEVQGSFDVCGDCGSVHADTTLTIGSDDVDICENATSTVGVPTVDPTAQIGGDVKQAINIPVPIANPYLDTTDGYVPDVTLFDTTNDPEVDGTVLECPAWEPTNNPGGTKYFALVGDNVNGLVFKAYWNAGTNGWEWELIDKLRDGHNTVLDDCGRVVTLDGATFTGAAGRLPDTGAIAPGVDDGTDNNFYDFTFGDAGGPAVTCDSDDDDTLSDTDDNDFGSPSTDEGYTFMLPGTNAPDTLPDFVPEDCMKNNENQWGINGGNVWSPLYNAVIFVYGNLGITGGPDTLCSSVSACTAHAPLPGSVWRVTFIAFNNINAGGTPAYGPARSFPAASDYQYLLIAGRDIKLAGTPGEGDICPNTCGGAPTVLAGYAGFIRAHEQLSITGNATVNGIISAEDAATCTTFINGAGIQADGSAQIYYDCKHPPSNLLEGVTLTSWEEIQ